MLDLLKSLDPIQEIDGFLVKRGDLFELGYVNGSKVRQCLHVVEQNLENIKTIHNGTLITGAGLPSPQTAITAQVANYFGLKCTIVTPKYDNTKIDLDRINISIAQKLGASIYGIYRWPTVYENEVKAHIALTNPYEIKFGMIGTIALEPVIYQTQNIPDNVEEITIISGSGLSALSVLMGVKKHGKNNVKRINILDISGHIHKNKVKWYDSLPNEQKFQGVVNLIKTEKDYRYVLKTHGMFDYTYESKAWDWLIKNNSPSLNHLFWVVGVKSRDLSLVEPIDWKDPVSRFKP